MDCQEEKLDSVKGKYHYRTWNSEKKKKAQRLRARWIKRHSKALTDIYINMKLPKELRGNKEAMETCRLKLKIHRLRRKLSQGNLKRAATNISKAKHEAAKLEHNQPVTKNGGKMMRRSYIHYYWEEEEILNEIIKEWDAKKLEPPWEDIEALAALFNTEYHKGKLVRHAHTLLNHMYVMRQRELKAPWAIRKQPRLRRFNTPYPEQEISAVQGKPFPVAVQNALDSICADVLPEKLTAWDDEEPAEIPEAPIPCPECPVFKLTDKDLPDSLDTICEELEYVKKKGFDFFDALAICKNHMESLSSTYNYQVSTFVEMNNLKEELSEAKMERNNAFDESVLLKQEIDKLRTQLANKNIEDIDKLKEQLHSSINSLGLSL